MFAWFPEEDGGTPGYEDTYAHVGQHGSASRDYIDQCVDASPAEYSELLAELTDIYGIDHGDGPVALELVEWDGFGRLRHDAGLRGDGRQHLRHRCGVPEGPRGRVGRGPVLLDRGTRRRRRGHHLWQLAPQGGQLSMRAYVRPITRQRPTDPRVGNYLHRIDWREAASGGRRHGSAFEMRPGAEYPDFTVDHYDR